MEIFLFIIAAGVIAHLIGASVHEGIFVGALVRSLPFTSQISHQVPASCWLLQHGPFCWHVRVCKLRPQ